MAHPPGIAHAESSELSTQIHAAREVVRAALLEGVDGHDMVREYSARLRSLLVAMVNDAVAGWDAGLGAVSVLETGSLARDELCPYADIDLIVLCEQPLESEESFGAWMRGLLHPLWDCGLMVKSVTQTSDAWIDGAAEDLSLCTSLLDARVLGGDTAMLAPLQARMMEDFGGERRLGLLMRLREEMERRFARYGGTVYKVEPDLKLGAGGLRDSRAPDHGERVARRRARHLRARGAGPYSGRSGPRSPLGGADDRRPGERGPDRGRRRRGGLAEWSSPQLLGQRGRWGSP